MSEATRSAVQADVDAVKEALKGTDMDALKVAMDKLNTSAMTIGQEIYPAQQQADAAGEGASAPADDDVIDAEVVDDQDAK